jgi:hypothetical protein
MERIGDVLGRLGLDPQSLRAARTNVAPIRMKEGSSVTRAQLHSSEGGRTAVSRGTPANDNAGPKRTHAPVLRGAVPLVVVWG